MKVQLDTIIASQQALNTLLSAAVPVKTAYWLSKIAKQFGKELDAFTEARNALIVKLGVEDPEVKGKFSVSEANMPEFTAQVTPLLQVELTVLPELATSFEGIKIADLGDIKVSAAVLSALDWLIVD